MEKESIKFFLIIGICLVCGCRHSEKKEIGRTELSFDFHWHFHQGDAEGAHEKDFDHASWKQVQLPHDWSIRGEYSESNPIGSLGSYLPMGVGWYRKRFDWEPSWRGKLVSVHFDGVYMNSEVWVNGHYVGKRPNGYMSFLYDITPYLEEGSNVISVRVDNSKVPSARWYTGSGIYRHVWLKVVDPVHVPLWGICISTPEVSAREAVIEICTEVVNGNRSPGRISLETRIRTPSGETVKRMWASEKADDGCLFEQTAVIRDPRLWSPGDPAVYHALSYVKKQGVVVDSLTTLFGIRKLEFSAEDGFVLNGNKTLVKGVTNHEDGGGAVGCAIPEDTRHRQIKILKEMGCYAIRTGHHPFAEEFYNMCDTMGFLVLEDLMDGWRYTKARYDYGLYFEAWWERDISDFIKRSRNHPGIFMYCLGNEVRGYESEQEALADRRMLDSLVKSIDDTRPTTQAGHPFPRADNAVHLLDVMGFNGNGETKGAVESFHEKHPGVPVIGTEMTHTFQTRGVYRTKTRYLFRDNPIYAGNARYAGQWESSMPNIYLVPDLTSEELFPEADWRYGSSYDNHIIRVNVRDEWKRVRDYDYLMGDFRWSGFDYLGSSGRKKGWPARTDTYGIIDLCGFPKDHYYLYQSLWDDEPMVHILPHWTHPGKEGVEIPVVAYTNAGSAELFLNGASLGRKAMTGDLQIVWKVPYRPGVLEVKAYEGERTVAVQRVKTAGEPYGILVRSDRTVMAANRRDVAHLEVEIVDKEGTLVPDAGDTLHFTITGPARMLGVENGDILDLSPHGVPWRKAFKGKCLLVIQATDQAGTVLVEASGAGLQTGEVQIQSGN